MAQKIKMVYVCVWEGEGCKSSGEWGGGAKMRSVLGAPQVGGHFITFLVDHTTVDTFFAHQQD